MRYAKNELEPLL